MAHLAQLSRDRPKGKTDEHFVAEITRLDSELVLLKDDLVRVGFFCCSTFT